MPNGSIWTTNERMDNKKPESKKNKEKKTTNMNEAMAYWFVEDTENSNLENHKKQQETKG